MMTKERKLEIACEIARLKGGLEHAISALNDAGVMNFGIESISDPHIDYTLYYINMGDTYDPTVCYDGSKYFVSDWGTWVEETEDQFSQDFKEVRCPNCGEWVETESLGFIYTRLCPVCRWKF